LIWSGICVAGLLTNLLEHRLRVFDELFEHRLGQFGPFLRGTVFQP
jgi:hypothetical protein